MSLRQTERIASFYEDEPRAGFTAEISERAIAVTYPPSHWRHLRARDATAARADGLSWVEADIDTLCQSIKSVLMRDCRVDTPE